MIGLKERAGPPSSEHSVTLRSLQSCDRGGATSRQEHTIPTSSTYGLVRRAAQPWKMDTVTTYHLRRRIHLPTHEEAGYPVVADYRADHEGVVVDEKEKVKHGLIRSLRQPLEMAS